MFSRLSLTTEVIGRILSAFLPAVRNADVKRGVALSLFALLVLESALWAGLGSENTMYVGGTVTTIKEGTQGVSTVAGATAFVFQHPGGYLIIPYDRIDSLEYGQKAGRRVAMALLVNPVFIFSKKRKHYLTIGYKDENAKPQAVVLELGKDVVRDTLSTLEARSGRRIEYQKEEEVRDGAQENQQH